MASPYTSSLPGVHCHPYTLHWAESDASSQQQRLLLVALSQLERVLLCQPARIFRAFIR